MVGVKWVRVFDSLNLFKCLRPSSVRDRRQEKETREKWFIVRLLTKSKGLKSIVLNGSHLTLSLHKVSVRIYLLVFTVLVKNTNTIYDTRYESQTHYKTFVHTLSIYVRRLGLQTDPYDVTVDTRWTEIEMKNRLRR